MITVHVGEQEFAINPRLVTIVHKLEGGDVLLFFADGSVAEFSFSNAGEALDLLRAVELYACSRDPLMDMQNGEIQSLHSARRGYVRKREQL